MPALQHLRRADGEEAIWDGIDADGAVVVDDFLAPEDLASLRDEVAPLISAHAPGARTEHPLWTHFHGTQTKRITGLVERSPTWVRMLCDPIYVAMADRYLGKDEYWLNTGQLICIGPDETPQLLHRDELNWPEATSPERQITVTAIFALTDFTAENGATVIAPGSHRWPGAMPDVPPEATCRAEMPAGAALLYDGKVIHGGGANRTADQWRVGLHAGFVRGWLRAEENHQLTTSLETARGLPEHVQRMLGFRSYAPDAKGRLGMVDYEDCAHLL